MHNCLLFIVFVYINSTKGNKGHYIYLLDSTPNKDAYLKSEVFQSGTGSKGQLFFSTCSLNFQKFF